MRNLWFDFWAGFDRIFSDPKEIHRVLVIIPLSMLVSHAIYVYASLVDNYVYTASDKVLIWLGSALSLFILCWCLRSNEMTIDLFNRFAIVSGLSGLFHRMIFYAIELGDPYFVTMAVISFLIFGLWAVTGKNYRDFKNTYIRPALKIISKIFIRNEKKANLYPINTRDSAINE